MTVSASLKQTTQATDNWRIVLLGVGNLGSALARGIHADIPVDLVLCKRRLEQMPIAVGDVPREVLRTNNAKEAVRDADAVFLLAKPKDIPTLLSDVADALPAHALVVSCAAGVSVEALQKIVPQHCCVRAMPSVGALFGVSDTAVYFGSWNVDPRQQSQKMRAEAIFDAVLGAVGTWYAIQKEDDMHTITAAAASGPAFFLLALEALIDGSIAAGLPYQDAVRAANGALRTAQALAESGESPAALRARIASPAGTTWAGLAVLERGAVRAHFLDAVAAAALRSRTLSHAQAGAESKT